MVSFMWFFLIPGNIPVPDLHYVCCCLQIGQVLSCKSIRIPFPQDVGCAVDIGVHQLPIVAAVQPALCPCAGKIFLFIIHPVGRDEVPGCHIRLGSVTFFLLHDRDLQFAATIRIHWRSFSNGTETNA